MHNSRRELAVQQAVCRAFNSLFEMPQHADAVA